MSNSTPAQRDAQRYGSAARSRVPSGKLVALGIVGMTLIAAVIIVMGMNRANQASIAPYEVGYEVVSDSQAQIKVDVRRDDPSVEGFCIVYALDYDFNEVGRREFYVPPGETEYAHFVVSIDTRGRATAANTYGCGETIPSYLDKTPPAPAS